MAYRKQQLKDKLIEHTQYIDKHGQDMQKIGNGNWSRKETQKEKAWADMNFRMALELTAGKS